MFLLTFFFQQGREADIVVTSLVRCNDKGSLGFLKKHNRLNVMLSRTKMFMCVVGHFPTMKQSKRSNLFSALQAISDKVSPQQMHELLEVKFTSFSFFFWGGGRRAGAGSSATANSPKGKRR